MAILKQSTAYTRMFLMVDSTDHFTGKTGLTVTVTLSKAGGSFGAAGGSITEVANGFYKIALTTTDTNTLGDLAYHATATGADATDFVDQVSVRLIDDLCFPTVSGRSLDVTAAGEAGIDWANIGSPTTTVGLSGTTVKTATDVETDTADIQSRLPAALTGGGNIKADVLALSGDTTAADNSEAFFDGTGYAGTNNVIPTVTTVNGFAAVAIDATAIATGAIDADALATDAVTEIWAKSLTEPTAVVGASPTAIAALSWLLTLSRNKITQSATTQTLFADDTSTTIATSAVSDSGTVFTRAEFA